ncbi:acyltransferase family protein [Microbulbifer magnicolonia]|uniref:acyltransferase family protein n=1 Tax=Microbulbifer magnicolonia TaxID=3109744 RepID=UPI002B4025AE|nr:acyltransferase family protein [Microbulbifer sp. GG15]
MTGQLAVRLHHLDLLRASMMFLGVLVHASHADYDTGTFEIIRFMSDSFRMACFFIISGYFSAMIFARKDINNFYIKRLPLLFVPAVFCTAILVPITNSWMDLYFARGESGNAFVAGWMGHAWFLYVLLIFTLATPAIVLLQKGVAGFLVKKVSPIAICAVFLLLIITGSIGAEKIVSKFGPALPYYGVIDFLISSTFIYLPYFIIGIYMYQWPSLYAFAHRYLKTWVMLALVFIAYRYWLWFQEITSTAQYFLSIFVDYLTAIPISFALFALTNRLLGKPNVVVRTMSDSAYTVYIVHYLFVALILLTAQGFDLPLTARLILAFALTSVVAVLFHIHIVQRYWVIRFLLNGRLPRKLPDSSSVLNQ